MKRRAFLAAASLLSLCAAPAALAAPKKKAAAKPASKKPAASKKPVKASRPPAQARTTPENSVLEAAHQGSSATRLPPVRAPEPPALWRTFEIRTSVQLKPARSRQRLWLPLPLSQDTLYQRNLGHTWQGNFEQGGLRRLPDGELEAFYCEWKEGVAPRLDLTLSVATADRHFDISRRSLPPEREDILRRNLQASRQIPNDGEAHRLAQRIIGRILDPVAQAKAIFDWVVDNTEYDMNLPGIGTGDVRRQLEQHRFGGRSADINGLFVALCRAIGIPARRVFGHRIEQSRIAPSLGIQRGDATLAAHCRAEFYVPGYSWIPVDPSDVRRTIALEALDHRDPKLVAMRKILFGVWEMNWMAYNVAEDLVLPDSNIALNFFAQPQLVHQDGAVPLIPGESGNLRIEARQIL
ncbi:MAG: transglutaminase-like domain-containing protein [Azovibrio sp.]|nr:transglutaminase-like domain-containing protein [Azovibrio sp.]